MRVRRSTSRDRQYGFAFVMFVLLSGCGSYQPPPPHVAFGGLPLSGSLADAHYASFTRCIEDSTRVRCRRNGVMLLGQGPYNAAVDLDESDASGGFDQLTLWHDQDQNAVFAIGKVLKQRGWTVCMTGEGARGDQEIYTRPGAPVWFSMDISYWGKRRMRVLPAWNRKGRDC